MIKILLSVLLATLLHSPAAAWWNPDWSERRQVRLDATALPRGDAFARIPVLIRLHGGNFDFTRAKRDGSDLQFVADDDRTPLSFHVERFDPVAELGLVWVDLTRLAPGAEQRLWLYYGNKAADTRKAPAATYDGEQSLVLHLNEHTGALTDQTANGNKIAAAGGRPVIDGLIAGGMALAPDGWVTAEPSRSLAVRAGGQMSWTGWIKPDPKASGDALIYSKLGESADRLTLGLRGYIPYVKLGGAEAVGPVALTPGTWTHLAVTAGEAGITLYVNGAQAGRIAVAVPALTGADIIGSASGAPGFAGLIDEIGRSNVARSAAYIAALAQSQRRSSAFAIVAPTAESAGQGQGHFGLLFGALTWDAQLVILLLAIMAGISWVVMVSKWQLFARTASANKRFLAALRRQLAEQDPKRVLRESPLPPNTDNSSLGRLFVGAQEELALRLAEAEREGFANRLPPESVGSIRAVVDAAAVREGQRLSAWMVLLTIAISGGPFLGLLGTVVGVMITFADVAAAGEVNVTAIAPGIAAALLATVAGLGVAIPALFGYNYLSSRLNNIAADNHIFVDELEKRIADSFRFSRYARQAE